MSKDLKKDMLFFKTNCKYCQDVLACVVQGTFVMVDIDKMSSRLPPFVKQVPLIYTSARRIITGDEVIAYVQHQSPQPVVQQHVVQQQRQQQQTVDPQEPTSYTFGNQNFGMISPNESPGMEFGGNKFHNISTTPQPDPISSCGRTQKIAPEMYEAFLAQRRAETSVTGNAR